MTPEIDYHTHSLCGHQLDWRLNEEADDFGWWCLGCEAWVPEDEAEKVIAFDRDDITAHRAERREER